MNLIWRVDPAPTGVWRSFQRRGWPSAHWPGANEQPAAYIVCDDEYRPASLRDGAHGPLSVMVADWSAVAGGFEWKRLKTRTATLSEAKALAERFLDAHPEYKPEAK